MDAKKKTNQLISNLRRWCASPTSLNPSTLHSEIKKTLQRKHPRAIPMASANLTFLANWHGQHGLHAVLDNKADGWTDIHRAFQYLWWAIRIEPSNAMVSRAACCLAHAIALSQDESANWLAERMIKSIDDNAFLTWKHSPFGVFVLHLWSLQNGSSAPDLARRQVAKIGVYQSVLDEWTSEDRLAQSISRICDYHLEQTRESLPLPEFVHIPYYLYPVEVAAISRIRERLNLPMPQVVHPLLATPLAATPRTPMTSILEEDEAARELISKAEQNGFLQ
jgi:hypothetical protein